MSKKKGILAVNIALIVLFIIMMFTGCSHKKNYYTVEEHIERVSALVEARYMNDNYNYSGYEVYPLYDENENLGFFVIEFEPYGFVYVRVNESDASNSWSVSMYTRYSLEGTPWQRYNIEKITSNDEFGQTVERLDKKFETDENGENIEYKNSHFKVANINGENRFLLNIKSSDGRNFGYIPAVKRGEKYLNLVSMEEFDLNNMVKEEQAISNIVFIHKNDFNL